MYHNWFQGEKKWVNWTGSELHRKQPLESQRTGCGQYGALSRGNMNSWARRISPLLKRGWIELNSIIRLRFGTYNSRDWNPRSWWHQGCHGPIRYSQVARGPPTSDTYMLFLFNWNSCNIINVWFTILELHISTRYDLEFSEFIEKCILMKGEGIFQKASILEKKKTLSNSGKNTFYQVI